MKLCLWMHQIYIIKHCPAASSPPHVLVAGMDRGCWKAGCRSSRSFAALELLEETSRKTRALVTITLVTHQANIHDKAQSKEQLSLNSMLPKACDCRFVLRSTNLFSALITVTLKTRQLCPGETFRGHCDESQTGLTCWWNWE